MGEDTKPMPAKLSAFVIDIRDIFRGSRTRYEKLQSYSAAFYEEPRLRRTIIQFTDDRYSMWSGPIGFTGVYIRYTGANDQYAAMKIAC